MELSKQTTDRTYRHPDCSVRPASADLLNDPTGDERGCTLVLEPPAASEREVHHDTAIPKPVPGIREIRGAENRKVHSAPSGTQESFSLQGDSGSVGLRFSEDIPGRIRKMYSLFEYEGGFMQVRAGNFYRQALFMQDYEDDVPWKGNYTYYFPTYHSLTVSQLRGYFSWRTRIRRGEYCPIPTSIAYLYIYELLNGIGADSPEDRINKIKEFEAGFLDSGIGDPRMRKNLHRWIFELAVVHNLPLESAKLYLDPELIRRDEAISILLHPEMHTDEEVFSALCILGGDKLSKSPAALYPEKGKQLFREAWLAVSSHDFGDGTDFHTMCFGVRKMRPWYPFANAVYYWQEEPEDREYAVDECRIYCCRNGSWLSESYEKLHFDKTLFQSFLRETDRMLRLYLKTGRYLKEKEADACKPLPAGKAPEELKPLPAWKAPEELKPPPAGKAPEELKPLPAGKAPEELNPPPAKEVPKEAALISADTRTKPELPLDPVQIRILLRLLRGSSPADIIREHHLMPSLIADAVNEAMYDEFGDTVISCDDDELSIIDDYREDLAHMLEGANR